MKRSVDLRYARAIAFAEEVDRSIAEGGASHLQIGDYLGHCVAGEIEP